MPLLAQNPPAEKALFGALDRAEERVLAEIERWLREVLARIPWSLPPAALARWHPETCRNLSKILADHASRTFRLGRVDGKALARLARDHKLADYSLPEFNFDYDAEARVLPVQAIRQMEARQLVLAGVFEFDLIAGVKKILVGHLAGVPRKDAEAEIAGLIQKTRDRASLIVTTETTYAYNRGRLVAFKESGVDYVRFSAVMDARTSPQCRSRHGKVMRLDDPDLATNTPPLHGRCRSVLTPVYSRYQPELITAEAQDWSQVAPLPKGWRAGGQVPPALPTAPALPEA
ncbi:MAG: minor capsid protein [Bacillota bacterium]|nr:minor capsid protein [Bacillota bacterium]